jgi:hypothetical protein
LRCLTGVGLSGRCGIIPGCRDLGGCVGRVAGDFGRGRGRSRWRGIRRASLGGFGRPGRRSRFRRLRLGLGDLDRRFAALPGRGPLRRAGGSGVCRCRSGRTRVGARVAPRFHRCDILGDRLDQWLGDGRFVGVGGRHVRGCLRRGVLGLGDRLRLRLAERRDDDRVLAGNLCPVRRYGQQAHDPWLVGGRDREDRGEAAGAGARGRGDVGPIKTERHLRPGGRAARNDGGPVRCDADLVETRRDEFGGRVLGLGLFDRGRAVGDRFGGGRVGCRVLLFRDLFRRRGFVRRGHVSLRPEEPESRGDDDAHAARQGGRHPAAKCRVPTGARCHE